LMLACLSISMFFTCIDTDPRSPSLPTPEPFSSRHPPGIPHL